VNTNNNRKNDQMPGFVEVAASFRDPSGSLFMKDGVLYRGVYESYSSHYEYAKESGLYSSLINDGLLVSHDEVDVNKCKELGVDVIRRRTGGGSVYHDNKGEITYSVIAKDDLFPKGITESYHIICDWIVKSLANLNIQSVFKPINDIIVGNKKISGNAQTRRNKVLLQHGTILYDVDVDKMFSLLKVPDEKIKDKMIAAVKERVTCILDFVKVTQDETYEALVKGFTSEKEWEFGRSRKYGMDVYGKRFSFD